MRQKACILGLGYIGLPIACVLAEAGFDVVGVDIDEDVIERIKTNFSNPEIGLSEAVENIIKQRNFKTSNCPINSDVYVICVGTPLTRGKTPDLSQVNSAIEGILPYIKNDALIIIESTCPIGTTENIAKKLKRNCSKIHIAYCPERILPGNIFHELIHNDRIIGGIDNESTERAVNFYKSFVKGECFTTDARTAEAVKLAENTYRDINIGYANELSILAEQADININDLIYFANKHPRVNILNPGIGVGGHCIPIDSWFLVAQFPENTTIAAKAREANCKKTNLVLSKIIQKSEAACAKTIACFGLTYKPDVSDTRESPAMFIVNNLQEKFNVVCVDPYIENTSDAKKAVADADIIFILVAHKVFKDFFANNPISKKIIDLTGNCL